MVRIVSSLRRLYGSGPPVYVHTDNAAQRGLNFSALCAAVGCEWSYSAEAAGNPKFYKKSYEKELGQGLVYLTRLIERMRVCACEFLVAIEDDTCVRRRAELPPRIGDVGGLPAPLFSATFLAHAENVSATPIPRPTPWGCAGACYYRSASWTTRPITSSLVEEAFENDAWAVGYMDAVGPALGLLMGLRVVPWTALAQTHLEGQGFMQRVPVEERAFDHNCAEQRAARDEAQTSCGDVLWSEMSMRHRRGREARA